MTAPTAPITDADLRAVREAEEKMTPGPWEDDDHESHWSIHGPDGHIADVRCYRSPLTRIPEADANARGIRLLRNHAPGLFARLEAAEREVERLSGEVHECPKCGRACKQCECTEQRIAELEAAVRQADERVREERERVNMEWWQELVLVDNVAPNPAAAKDWLMSLSAHEQAEAAREEREKIVAAIRNRSNP